MIRRERQERAGTASEKMIISHTMVVPIAPNFSSPGLSKRIQLWHH